MYVHVDYPSTVLFDCMFCICCVCYCVDKARYDSESLSLLTLPLKLLFGNPGPIKSYDDNRYLNAAEGILYASC